MSCNCMGAKGHFFWCPENPEREIRRRFLTGDKWTEAEKAAMFATQDQPEPKICSICKGPITNGWCKCMNG